MKPTKIVVHSTGASNTELRRYVQPTKNQTIGMGGKTRDEMMRLIGKNKYENDWNRSGLNVAVHAFIGKLSDGSVATVQTLPWNICCWGVGRGSKGSFNNVALQFEMCEDNHSSKSYCKKVYNQAVELCVKLCNTYNISVKDIVSHKEAHEMGYGSNHGDPESWWSKFGFTMNGFRNDVEKQLCNTYSLPYKVRVTTDVLNIRSGPSVNYKINGSILDKGVYTITKVENGFGFLKSTAGWISLKYTEKYKN